MTIKRRFKLIGEFLSVESSQDLLIVLFNVLYITLDRRFSEILFGLYFTNILFLKCSKSYIEAYQVARQKSLS